MAFPTTGLLDDFNRANSNPISGSWANMAGINSSRQQILSNRAQSVGSGSNPEAYNAATYGPDTEVWATWVGQPTNNSERLELYARIANIANPNGYRLRVARNGSTWDWSLWIVTASSGTQLGSTVTGVSVPLGSKVGFEIVGTVLKGYLDTGGGSSQIISYDTAGDATKYSAAGYIGSNLNGLNNIIDDFGGGTVSGGTSPVSGQRRVVYSVAASVTGQRRVAYGVMRALTGQRRIAYGVLASATGQRRVVYSVAAPVTGQRRVVYGVLAGLSGQRRVVYSVASASGVSGSRTIVYGVLAAATGQRRVVYAVTQSVLGQRRVVYTVVGGVSGVRRISYVVGTGAGIPPQLPALFAG